MTVFLEGVHFIIHLLNLSINWKETIQGRVEHDKRTAFQKFYICLLLIGEDGLVSPQSQLDLQRARLSTDENEGKTIPVSLIYKNVFIFSAEYFKETFFFFF